MHYVYILQSKKNNSYYTGSTADIKKRLIQHNKKLVQSTKAHTPYIMIWYCSFINKNKSLLFEKYLKTGSGIAFARKRLLNNNK